MKNITSNNYSKEFPNIPDYSISPFTETFNTFIKTKKVILRERTYQGSRRPYERLLQQYFVASYFPHSIHVLPKLVNSFISYGRYSRYIKDLDQIVSFFILTVDVQIQKSRDLDNGYKKITQISEEVVNLAKSLNLTLFELPWDQIKKILFKADLQLSDFPISADEITAQKFGHIFSTITNDLGIFTNNGKLKIINRPDTTIPVLHHTIVMGKSLRDEKEVGLSSNQCVIYGNHSTKVKYLVLNFLNGLLPKGSNTDDLTIIYNFNDYQFDLPLDIPFIVKRFIPGDFSLDPFIIMQEYPELRITIIRSLIHIFEILPSEVGAFQGLISEYLIKMDRQGSNPASIGDFNLFIQTQATQMQGMGLDLSNNLSTDKESFDVSNEQVNLDTLETQTPIVNRTYQNIEQKIKYLFTITIRRNTSAIPIILRKKGVLLIQATKTNQQESLLAFILLTELAKIINPNYRLISIGFDSFLSNISNFTQQSYYRQYLQLAQRDTYLFHFKEYNRNYDSFIQLLGSEINTIWTDQIKNMDLPKKFQYILQDNTDIAILRRSDNSSLLIPFSISNKLQQFTKETIKQTNYNVFHKFRQLEPLNSVLGYKILEQITNQPHFINQSKYLAIQMSDYYFDGLKIIKELVDKNYIQKNYRLIKSMYLTPEAKHLLEAIPTFFGQYKEVDISSLLKMNDLDSNLDTVLPGIIRQTLPDINWNMVFLFLQYINNKLDSADVIDKLLEIASDINNTKRQESYFEEENNQEISVNNNEENSYFNPPMIEKALNANQQIAPGLSQRIDEEEIATNLANPTNQEIATPSSLSKIDSPTSTENRLTESKSDFNVDDLVEKKDSQITNQNLEEIRFKKTKIMPRIARKIVLFPQFTDKLKVRLSSVHELNALSLGENKKGFTSVILLGRDTQNNQASGIYSLVDEYYTDN
ncbi:MAG: hypothetical protein HeimC3_16180 [Candidatus Heimdallarchaeota archaeon LC_3]|nr:MAG: hypothetical protein HeimC3_16180 [Candidatus Heimdallarchaeota archaeon LC_3]